MKTNLENNSFRNNVFKINNGFNDLSLLITVVFFFIINTVVNSIDITPITFSAWSKRLKQPQIENKQ
jgi:hypothetical protein